MKAVGVDRIEGASKAHRRTKSARVLVGECCWARTSGLVAWRGRTHATLGALVWKGRALLGALVGEKRGFARVEEGKQGWPAWRTNVRGDWAMWRAGPISRAEVASWAFPLGFLSIFSQISSPFNLANTLIPNETQIKLKQIKINIF